MFKLFIAKILILLAIVVYCLTVYMSGSLTAVGYFGGAFFLVASQMTEWETPLKREFSPEKIILYCCIISLLKRFSIVLGELGFDINRLIVTDQKSLYIIFVGFVMYSSVDLFRKVQKIRCLEC